MEKKTKSKKTYMGLRCNGQYFYCSFPFSLDTYQGCTHKCKYCFSYFNYLLNCSTKGKKFFDDEAKTINYNVLERAFNEEPNEKDGEIMKIYKGLIKLRMPLHWGGISDPFSNFEKCNEEKVSLKTLRLLAKHQYPVIMSTKGDWLWNNPEYLEAMKANKNMVIQISLISVDPAIEKIEPGTKINGRLQLIKAMSNTHRVVVRCQPFIPKFCEKNTDSYLETIKEMGASAVTIEFMKLSNFKTPEVLKGINEISKAVGFDVLKFYKWKAVMTGTDSELRDSYKLPILKKFKAKAHKLGLEFYAADNSLRDYGDSPICCGLPLGYPGFDNYLSTNSSRALFLAMENGQVTFDEMYGNMKEHEKIFMNQKISPWLNLGSTEGHLKYDHKTFMEKAAYIWDNPKNPNNPAQFFKNLVVSGKDENNHLIYKYKRED